MEIANYMRKQSINIFGICEVNLNTRDTNQYKKLVRELRQYLQDQTATITTSTTLVPWTKKYKPGGTAILNTGDITHNTTSREIDKPYGRWCTIIIGPPQHNIAIVTAYIVCNTPITHNRHHTAAYQQWLLMSRKGIKGHPRDLAINDLITHLTTLRTQGKDIILLMDANSARDGNNSVINKIQEKSGLNEIKVNQNIEIPTYRYGTKQVDFVMATDNIAPYIAQGYIQEFGIICNSDHRSIIIDIHLDQFIKDSVDAINRHTPRLITSKTPSAIHQYKLDILNEIEHPDIQQLITSLSTNLNLQTQSPTAYNELCQLDQKFTAIRLKAEKNLKKDPSKYKAPWSPPLAQAYLNVQFWLLRKWEIEKGRDYCTRINCIRNQIKNTLPTTTELSQIKKYLEEARNTLKQCRLNAQELRQSYLWEQATAHEIAGNNEARNALNQIIRIEEVIRRFKKLRQYFYNKTKNPTSSILIPSTTKHNEWTHITDLKEIHDAINKHSQQHFSQAHGTPPTTQPLLDILGDGPSEKQDRILSGQVNLPPDIGPTTRQFIRNLKQEIPIPIESTIIAVAEVKQAFKKWREKTTTSPSGLHLGHYKALLSNDGKHYDTINPDPADKIWQIITLIINTTIHIGQAPPRWHIVHQLLLQKINGNKQINKQRRVNIYESDYNFLLKYFWPHKIHPKADTLGILGKNQFGGRKGHQTHDIAFINELIMEYHRITHTTLAITQHDNRSCFDRTVPNITSLCNQKAGIPKKICSLVNKIRQNTKYYTSTKDGISKEPYYHHPTSPVYGSGQGSGNAGSEWNFISVPLMQTLEKLSDGCEITDPTKKKWKKTIVGFVDDTKQFNNIFGKHNDIIQNLKIDAQLWSNLLQLSGGAVNLGKCEYLVMTHKQMDNGTIRIYNASANPLIIQEGETNN